MKIIKIIGIIVIAATLFISGGVFFHTQPTIEQQLATPAATPDTSSPSGDRGYTPIQITGSLSPTITTRDLGALNQISLQSQQQIYAQMQACMQNARQAQQALNVLNARKDALDRQIDSLNERIADIDTSTDRGKARRDQLKNERNRVQDQRATALRNIGEVNRQFNRTRSDCRGRINDLRERKRTADSQMLKVFNQSVNVKKN